MKQVRKMLSLVLALCLLLSFSAGVFAIEASELPAAPTNGNTNVSLKEHTFKAYQIFSAAYSEATDENGETTQTLTAIKWGNGIDPQALWNDLTGAGGLLAAQLANVDFAENNDALNSNPSALALAQIVAGYAQDSDAARAFANVVDRHRVGNGIDKDGTITPGYYLVVDTTDLNGTQTVNNISVLAMSTTTVFDPQSKANVPSVDKQVLEVNDSANTSPSWSNVADYDIGDHVPFLLTGTLPSNYADYESYTYVFHDTLSEGLVLDENSIQVFVNGAEVEDTSLYSTVTQGNDSLTVTFSDLKTLFPTLTSTSYIRVAYTAQLTDAASIDAANSNQVVLEFSNNPNQGGDGSTGTTPPETVYVFTYELNVSKVDNEGEALDGAEFQLFKYDADATGEDKYVAVGDPISGSGEDGNLFAFSGLDAGRYMLSETTVPAGYNKAEDMYFQITATYGANPADVPTLSVGTVTDAAGNELEMSFTSNTSGHLGTAVVNLRGLVLPATGGIGTTIFYVAGGLLLVGASVLLIAKKRMSKQK